MTELLPFLKQLISAPGLSGYEAPVRRLVEDAWRPLTDELHHSRLGSLHGVRRGIASEPRHSLLFTAHMDAIGLMVTGVVDGFLRLTKIGGLDPRVLPGQVVTVHGRQELPGTIVQPPAHLLPPEIGSDPVPLEYLLVDVGLSPRQVEQLVGLGDLVSFAQPPLEMGENYLAGHSLDNRVFGSSLDALLAGTQRTAVELGSMGSCHGAGRSDAGRGADLGLSTAPNPGSSD